MPPLPLVSFSPRCFVLVSLQARPLAFTVLLDGVHLAIMRANIDGAIGNCR